jgi:hypothetical protein
MGESLLYPKPANSCCQIFSVNQSYAYKSDLVRTTGTQCSFVHRRIIECAAIKFIILS